MLTDELSEGFHNEARLLIRQPHISRQSQDLARWKACRRVAEIDETFLQMCGNRIEDLPSDLVLVQEGY